MTLYDDRLALAREIAGHVVERYGDDVRAVGLQGSMAHGSSAVDQRSDIDIVVIARDPTAIPERELFLGDVLISMGVTSEAALIEEASDIRWDWAIASDGYVSFKPLYDPAGLFDAIKHRHDSAVHAMSDAERTERARALLMGAFEWVAKGERSIEQSSPQAASVCVSEALATIALSVGLFTVTRWRGFHVAVAATADTGRSIPDFAGAYARAADVDRSVSERLEAAAHACDVLWKHFAALGARSEVSSVRELFD